MAEEEGYGRLTSVVVSCTCFSKRLGNTLHVALLCLTCAERQPMHTSVNDGNRARRLALSLALQAERPAAMNLQPSSHTTPTHTVHEVMTLVQRPASITYT